MYNLPSRYLKFNFANNVSTGANIDTLKLDSTLNKVYNINYSILREYTNGLTYGKGLPSWGEKLGAVTANAVGSAQTDSTVGYQSTGKFLLCGTNVVYSNQINTSILGASPIILARFNPDGSADPTFPFSTTLGAGISLAGFKVLPDDSIIGYGTASIRWANGIKPAIYKVSANGVLDTAFMTNIAAGFNGVVKCICVQSDGKIVVGGTFTTFKGVTRNRIVRLNADGTEDTAFYTSQGTGFGAGAQGILAITQQADGKLLIGGLFTTWNSVAKGNLIRLNTDGTEDTAFTANVGTGSTVSVGNVKVDSNGNIVLYNSNNTWNGVTRSQIVRLLPTGAVDTTFMTNNGGAGLTSGLGAAQGLQIASDNSIYVAQGSSAGAWNGVIIVNPLFFRILSTGVIDTASNALIQSTGYGTFTPPTVRQITLVEGGKFIICGGTNMLSYGNVASGSYLKISLATQPFKAIAEGTIVARYIESQSRWIFNHTNALGMPGYETLSGLGKYDCGIDLFFLPSGQIRYNSTNIPGTKVNDYIRMRITEL